MAGANLTSHAPILPYQTTSGNTDRTLAIAEASAQTFLQGTPLMLSAGGFVQAWDGATIPGIIGVSKQPGANLAANGAGQPTQFMGVGFPGAVYAPNNVLNEPAAVSIYRGVPFTDGRTYFDAPVTDTLFIAMFDNSAGVVAADWTPVQSDISVKYGMTKDANGFWYVDKNKTGASAVVQIVGLDPNSLGVANGNVIVQFLASAVKLIN